MSDYNEKFYGWNWLVAVLVLIGFCAYLVIDYKYTEWRCLDIGREISQKIDTERRKMWHPKVFYPQQDFPEGTQIIFETNQDFGDSITVQMYVVAE